MSNLPLAGWMRIQLEWPQNETDPSFGSNYPDKNRPDAFANGLWFMVYGQENHKQNVYGREVYDIPYTKTSWPAQENSPHPLLYP